MGAKSKQKGNRFERRCAQLLSEFTGVAFRRIPSSGAFNKFGGVVVADHVFSGDIICDDKNFVFSVEAKDQKAFSFTAILRSPSTSAFIGWWKQCVEDAIRVNKLPMLIFKPNAQDDYTVLTDSGMLQLELSNRDHFSINVHTGLPTPKIYKWTTIMSTNPTNMFNLRG